MQVREYFQDFDPLRSGMITKSQFQRGLSDLGLSALGHHNLTPAQFEALYQVYKSTQMPDKVLWTQFMDDIESGKSISARQVLQLFNSLLVYHSRTFRQ